MNHTHLYKTVNFFFSHYTLCQIREDNVHFFFFLSGEHWMVICPSQHASEQLGYI